MNNGIVRNTKTQQTHPRQAIVLFTRSPRTEAKAKPLAGLSFLETQRLYASLTTTVLNEACTTGLPVIVATDDCSAAIFSEPSSSVQLLQQRGSSFGQRLSAATHDAFERGYDELVIIGNDCVNVTSQTLCNAFTELEASDVVLGSAKDGGVYLIAAKNKSREEIHEIFENCRWKTGFVQEDIYNNAANLKLRCALLETFTDIDSSRDFINVIAHRAATSQPHASVRDNLYYFALLLLHRHALYFSTLPLVSLVSQKLLRLRYQKAPPRA